MEWDGGGDAQIHTWELVGKFLVGLEPISLERSAHGDKTYVCTFGIGCLGKLGLGTFLSKLGSNEITS